MKPKLFSQYRSVRRKISQSLKSSAFKTSGLGTSLVVQWLRPCLPMQGVRVRPLVRELRSHMPLGQKARNNTVTNSIKTLKMVNILKKKKKSGLHWTVFILGPNSLPIGPAVLHPITSASPWVPAFPAPHLPRCSLTFQSCCEPSKPQLTNEVPKTSPKTVSKGQQIINRHHQCEFTASATTWSAGVVWSPANLLAERDTEKSWQGKNRVN